MEKYGVKIDPRKVEKEKQAGKGSTPNPNTNVPVDPELGTEPYEDKDAAQED
jgi:hypothetical protein